MVKVNVIAVGKVKEEYFSRGISEYSKRLGRFCNFKVIELEEENYSKVNQALVGDILKKEGDKILPFMDKGFNFVCAIEGKKFSSQNFATELTRLIYNGEGVINFIIGGSYGLDKRVKDKANKLFSVSDMTFPHTLFRLMLTEQIYRAFSINSGSAYHK